MLVSIAPAYAAADTGGDTLVVQTRTSSYTFKVGDTFTYSCWLRLTPDLVSYSEDQLVSYIIRAGKDLGITLQAL